jgi:hypothetical protein
MRPQSSIVLATVSTLKSLVDKSQSRLRSYIWPFVKRKACSELSLVVDDPTIIPAALKFCWPAMLAVLVVPPRVPKSVTP